MLKNKKVIFKDLGLIDYKKAWDFQKKLFNSIIDKKLENRQLDNESYIKPTKNYLLFCEHPHVYTLGKSGAESNLLLNNEELKKKADFVKIDRGGDITYHGPGQIVGYPILDLDNFTPNIRNYVFTIEQAIINTIDEFGLKGERLSGAAGVWLDTDKPGKARKICAIGIRSSRWVTMHGFAFNVNTDLNFYNYINPCGFTDKKVSSLNIETNSDIDISKVKSKLIKNIADLFEMEIVSLE